MKILPLLDIIDIFPTKITLFRGNSSKISTTIGKVLSILVFSYIIYSFCSSNMIKRKNPNSLQQTLNLLLRSKFSFDEDNFEYAIGVNDDDGVFFNDSSYFGINAYLYYRNNTDLSYNYTYLDLVPCTKDNFKDSSIFETLKLNGTFCFKKGTKIDIHGFWDEKTAQYLGIDLFKCTNTTNNTNENRTICKSEEEINEFLKFHYAQIFMTNNYIDISNFDNPLTSSLKTFYTPIASEYAKKNTLYMSEKFFQSEYGVITRQTDNLKTYEWSNVEVEIYTYPPIFYTMNMYSSDRKKSIERKYQTIENFFGEMGGILNFVFVFAFSLVKIEEKYKLTMSLGNKLNIFQSLKLKKGKRKKNNELKKRKKVIKKQLSTMNINNMETKKSQNISNNNDFSALNALNAKVTDKKQTPLIKLNKIIINDQENLYEGSEKNISLAIQNIDSLVNENIFPMSYFSLQKNEKTINFSESPTHFSIIKRIESLKNEFSTKKKFFFGYFKYVFLLFKLKRFFLNEQDKIYLQAENFISKEMDIFIILKKLREIDKLKKIMFTKNHLFFFHLLPDPLNYGQKKLEKKLSLSKKGEDIKKKYFKLNENAKNSEMDKKILKHLHDDAINDFFNNILEK